MNSVFQRILFCFLILCLFSGCKKDNYPDIIPNNSGTVSISTDKARYNPGDQVLFTSSKSLTGTIEVRYKYLATVIDQQIISDISWSWTVPLDDFKGYMAELYNINGTTETLISTVGIDVSSEWTRFPRYGFLTDFSNLTQSQTEMVLNNLNRHHINGLQYYDWLFKHHLPLAGTAENPTMVYKNIVDEDIYYATVKAYIDRAHEKNIMSMFYNLAFGALSDASYDGVREEWYIFTDKSHKNKDLHSLPKPPFKSDIFLVNPANSNWQSYLNSRNADVYAALDFDGFHIDQLGDRGTRYDYEGNQVNLETGYGSFIQATKSDAIAKYHVMNAVNQFGQKNIAAASVDFLYTEVWSPNDSYASLAKIIQDNDAFGNNQKNSVLAAYMNYNLANSTGYFNTPGVLFTNAVIFAFGGSHLELGEHMLGKEYFPNDNLLMRADLQKALVTYYDFLVAYQNLLRDGGTFNSPMITATDGKTALSQWPPVSGKISIVGKEFTDKQVIHLINLSTATHFDWRDNGGNQSYPTTVYNCVYSFTSVKTVRKVWFASPDYNNGASVELAFQTNGNSITFTLPLLSYWDMVVIEY